MSHWILKTEPSTYSFDQLAQEKTTTWDGVRNYQARNNLRLMKKGDLAMIYHSVGPKELVGIAEVIKEAFVDASADDGKDWVAVEIKFHSWLKKPVTLAWLKAEARLEDLSLVKQGRLSVCPVTDEEWGIIIKLAQR